MRELNNFVREENPFEETETAKLWIQSVENETGEFRDQYIYPKLKEWLGQKGLTDILDLGAGQGITSQFCEGKNYVGLEPSATLVDRAAEKYGKYGKFVIGNAYEIPFKEGSFDGIFSINVWFHLEKPETASAEVERVLRPNGKLLIVSANPGAYDVWESFYSETETEGKKMMGKVNIPHVTLPKNIFFKHSEDEIISGFENNGIKISEQNSFAPVNGKDLFKFYEGIKK